MKSRVVTAYAKALYSRYFDNEENFFSKFSEFITIYPSQLKIFFENSDISPHQKISTFQKISNHLKWNTSLEEIVAYLIRKDRIKWIEEIYQEIKKNHQLHRTECEIKVIFAFPPTQIQLDEIKCIFENKIRKKVQILIEIDREILGGCIIQHSDKEYNGSLRYQLENLKYQFQ